MSENADDESRVRKTVSFTQRQFLGGLGIVAAITSLSPLKDLIRDENRVTELRVARIENMQLEIRKMISDNDAEAIRQQERMGDKIVDRIREAEARVTGRLERDELRVDGLEAAIRSKSKRNEN